MSRVIKFRVWHRYIDHDKWRSLVRAASDGECPDGRTMSHDEWLAAMDAWGKRDKAHQLAASTWRMSYPDHFACDGDGFGWLVDGGHSDLSHRYESNVADEDTVIEQWTGLTDREGKEIYEGDILHYVPDDTWKVDYPHPFRIYGKGIVTWRIRYSGWIIDTIGETADSSLGSQEAKHSVIAGNIHEHPHLLKP